MIDAIEWVLGTLAIVLAGAAFAMGGQVIREAWRGAFKAARHELPGLPLAQGRPVATGHAASDPEAQDLPGQRSER
jgi:hypothetical protein